MGGLTPPAATGTIDVAVEVSGVLAVGATKDEVTALATFLKNEDAPDALGLGVKVAVTGPFDVDWPPIWA